VDCFACSLDHCNRDRILRLFVAVTASNQARTGTGPEGPMRSASEIKMNKENAKGAGFRWRLIKRALFHKKAKVLLILLAITMGASVITALLNLEKDLRYRMNRELRDYGPNVLVVPASGKTYLSDSTLKSLAEIGRGTVTALTPELFIPVHLRDNTAILVGADLAALRVLYPGWNFTVAEDRFDHPLYLGSRLAKRLNAGLGAKLQLESNGKVGNFTVAGLIEGGEAEDDRAFCNLASAQGLSGTTGYQTIALSALGTIPEVEQRFVQLQRSDPNLRVQLIHKIAIAETAILEKISRLMGLVILIIIAILFFCINTTVSAVLLARQREIALCRVLGARRKQIMTGLTLELMVLALAGGISGFVLGILMAQILGKLLFQTYIVPHASVFFITILSSAALMIVSSFLPIQKAINRQAALVLKEV
jgi:putative ABC transport system permease protein